ncbi:unnamed protein product [Candidula unifasciata]|uniref:Sulfotransferase domain-containing protein n=1 Tax=Candidula unifasciata TaxID=100452 RepID=A0A8S3Z7T4_9EUPU|nr:unnamed protein product [Candidula unifasciata]
MVSGLAVTGNVEKETCMMEFHKYIQDLDELPSPRILNNHQFFEVQPKDMLRKRVKVAFIYRNPKDVVVSYYHHVKRLNDYYEYTGDFKSFLVRFAEGLLDNNSMFDYLKSWENGIKENPDMNIYMVSYEDLQAEPLPHLRRLSKFLGKDYNDTFLESLVKATSFDAMKRQKGDVISDSSGSIMYRKGKLFGDWKNYFTVAQSLWFDHIIRTRMGKSTMFPFKYSI